MVTLVRIDKTYKREKDKECASVCCAVVAAAAAAADLQRWQLSNAAATSAETSARRRCERAATGETRTRPRKVAHNGSGSVACALAPSPRWGGCFCRKAVRRQFVCIVATAAAALLSRFQAARLQGDTRTRIACCCSLCGAPSAPRPDGSCCGGGGGGNETRLAAVLVGALFRLRAPLPAPAAHRASALARLCCSRAQSGRVRVCVCATRRRLRTCVRSSARPSRRRPDACRVAAAAPTARNTTPRRRRCCCRRRHDGCTPNGRHSLRQRAAATPPPPPPTDSFLSARAVRGTFCLRVHRKSTAAGTPFARRPILRNTVSSRRLPSSVSSSPSVEGAPDPPLRVWPFRCDSLLANTRNSSFARPPPAGDRNPRRPPLGI